MMSELRVETWRMPAADLGPDNPLPALHVREDVHAAPKLGPGIPPEMARNMAYGRTASCMPYTMQDGYNRGKRPRGFRAVVLENEALRATFLTELGGRLWSLVHKPSGRELLEVNPAFQPANLAIRNAWLSSGVEWNIGLIGHCVFTCSPPFAARVEGPGGVPALRLYEWERIRQVPFQVDAWLPPGSPVLLVRVRITNPHDHDVPMYWWSNMAVPETSRTRVLVPAEHSYRFDYSGTLSLSPIPVLGGVDVTYPTNLRSSSDFFFHIPDGGRRWIAVLDGQGRGLVQTSTDRLKGRKLFIWGQGPGGKRWQEFLSERGHAYFEVQAGLARTQMEHVPMPPGAEWSWIEAYGLMEADADAVHGRDWRGACACVEERLEALIPRAQLEAELKRGAEWADRPPAELIQRGSGWGALERLRREAAGERPFCGAGLAFDDDSLGREQEPWLSLLRAGSLSGQEPVSWMVQDEWRAMLEAAVAAGRGDDWASWLHLGVMRYHAGEREGARAAWERSLADRETPWALRNLALLARAEGRLQDAADMLASACRLRRDLLPLAVECARAMLEADRPQDLVALLEELPESVRSVPRLRLLAGQAALAAGQLDLVEAVLRDAIAVDDLREGEQSLSDLWFGLHERRLSAAEGVPVNDELRARVRREFPPPASIDFRMRADG